MYVTRVRLTGTAWTRLVEQRSLRRSRQVLRVAAAGSTSAKILAWERLAAFCPLDRFSHRPQKGTQTVPPAPWYPLSAQQGTPAWASALMMPRSRAARTS